MSHKQIVNWCRDNDVWYLKMDIEIPEVCIQEAQAVYDEGFFVEHRFGDGGNGGWKSASIHSFVEKGSDISLGWFHTKTQRVIDCERKMLSGAGQRLQRYVQRQRGGWRTSPTKLIDVYVSCY